MKNNGLFSTLFIESLKETLCLDDHAKGRMAALHHAWQHRDNSSSASLWNTFIKQAVGYLQFVPPNNPLIAGLYPLYEDWGFSNCISVLLLVEPADSLDDMRVGKFLPGVLVGELKRRKFTWGILTDGSCWRLYSTKTGKPYENYAELNLAGVMEENDEQEYAAFERFFQCESFVSQAVGSSIQNGDEESSKDGIYACRLDEDGKASEKILEVKVKTPLLTQIDEVLQYLCNGFIADTPRKGEEYTEEERGEIFESAVKLLYRCLFLFYAEARSLLPSEEGKAETYRSLSIRNLCEQARDFHWGKRKDNEEYTLWKHLKGLINAVNDGDPEYGIMGYDGGLFDDREEKFLGEHRLRNDFLARVLYLLAFVEPYDGDPEKEYPIPYEDLEVRHLGEMYENILEYTVLLADADRVRRKTKKGVDILLASHTTPQKGDTWIRKGDVFFGATALERKQTGSFYTPETLVSFLNEKAIIQGLRKRFDKEYRERFESFLKEARSGYDDNIRRGAAQSAIALVERFVREVVLVLKVCDPAMGSGHFLVNGSNQITDLIIEFLAQIPSVEGIRSEFTCQPNSWRRRITRNCLYGVDLNPLAVHLAKLSLWLNCFAREHRLTFLDHHIKCGNSLVGILTLEQLKYLPERSRAGKKNDKGKDTLFPLPDELSEGYGRAMKDIVSIGEIDEDDTDRQKRLYDDALREGVRRITDLGDLYTAFLMDSSITEDDYRSLFMRLVKGERPSGVRETGLLQKVGVLKKRHHFFHWALEFPEAFQGKEEGFHATTGNPPWDILKPNSQEFFSTYDSGFRKYGKQEANKAASQLMKDHGIIKEKWENYCQTLEEQSQYVRQPDVFRSLGKGDINTSKLFLERFFGLLRVGGSMGIVAPSGFYTDQGCQPLREFFFNKSSIDCLYCFENRRAIFNIHRSFKFILFVTNKGGVTDSFKCAFMEQNPEKLWLIDERALKMKIEHVKKFSPDTLSVMEFKSQRDIDITTKIYGYWPLLGDFVKGNWNVKLNRELDMTNQFSRLISREEAKNVLATNHSEHILLSAAIYNSNSINRVERTVEYIDKLRQSSDVIVPLFEGKMIWQFDSSYSEPSYWLNLADVAAHVTISSPLCARIAHRRISASTNERTLVSSIVPSFSVAETNCTVIWISDHVDPRIMVYLCCVINSFILDYLIRYKVTTTLNMFYIESLPVPRIRMLGEKDFLINSLAARCSRLILTGPEFSDIWQECFDPSWECVSFWYPPGSTSIDAYGPAHEQEIRRRIAEQAASLTQEWTPECGVYDRTKDRRDMGDRAQLRAEIDAYVAHLYGLSRDEFVYILDTFPVLKKKEEQIFGEFMSKRKCLEEYDRIATIL